MNLFDQIKSVLPEQEPNAGIITVIVDEAHALGKRFTVQPDGAISKTAQVTTSWANAMQFACPEAADLAALLRVVGNSPHAAIINARFPAVPLAQLFIIGSQKRITERFGPEADPRGIHAIDGGTVVARVREQTAPSSWQLLDRDIDEHTPRAMAEACFDEWIGMVDRILPGVAESARVLVPSASARVLRDGQPVGSGNGHVWVKAVDPADVERTRAAILARAVALGLAWPKARLSKTTGKVVGQGWTTIIDASVWTPGRLVFTGAPTVGVGLTVVPPDVHVVHGGRLDTTRAVIDAQATRSASEAAGCPLRVMSTGDKIEMVEANLRLDTELELDGGESTTVEDLMRLGTKKVRCQAPFRASRSMAAFFALEPSPFVFDSGTGIKHVLSPQAQAAVRGERLDAMRREAQKRENERIGEGEETIPTAELVSVEDALARFVFMEDGSRVADLLKPHYDLALSDFKNAYAASKVRVPQPPRTNADGSTTQRPPKIIPVADVWCASPDRLTVVTRTFKAGGPAFLHDPAGRPALNTWRAPARSLVVGDLQAAGIGLFLEQLEFLFEDSAPRFLEWLAHIEQAPGVLPHSCWLHIATQFGLGRNWLGGLLARVWPGSVAANFDLSAALKSGFTGRLSRKVLAIIDEIDEGLSEAKWQHAETVKRMLTEEHREINPKFGRKSVEFNACRMLLFSNHTHALPTVEGDRRVEVKILRSPPRSSEVYARLYKALDDPRFVAAVVQFLGSYDLSGFNPGRRALMDESKIEFQAAGESQTALWVKAVRDHWPVDLITNNDLSRVLDEKNFFGSLQGSNFTPAHRRTLAEYGFRVRGLPLKIDGKAARIQIIRNHDRWLAAHPHECRAELERWKPAQHNLRQELLDLSAEG